MEERDRRLERKLDEAIRLVRQNNRMLKRSRSLRVLKMVLTTVLLVGGFGYGYYLFVQYKAEFVQFQERVNELHTQTQKILQLGSQVKETAQSFSEVFNSRDE